MSTNELNTFGYFSETCPQLSHRLPSIVSAELEEAAHPKLDEIIRYLDNGQVYATAVGCDVHDPFLSDRIRVCGEISMLTDGTWIWPSSISYFVSKYNLSVPAEFIEHMLRNAWKVPSVPQHEHCERSPTASVAKSGESNWEPMHKATLLFASCNSKDQVAEICKSNLEMIVGLLGLADLNDSECLKLSDALSRATIPPKFVGENGSVASAEQIASDRTSQFVDMTADHTKLPLTWDATTIVWLQNRGDRWDVLSESWKEAFA